MKIAQIRDVIRGAEWLNNDYKGHLPREFVKADVGPRLAAKIAELEALVIPARFVRDIQLRADVIRWCRQTIADWERERANPTPVSTEHRCIWLGGNRCLRCGALFTP